MSLGRCPHNYAVRDDCPTCLTLDLIAERDAIKRELAEAKRHRLEDCDALRRHLAAAQATIAQQAEALERVRGLANEWARGDSAGDPCSDPGCCGGYPPPSSTRESCADDILAILALAAPRVDPPAAPVASDKEET